MQNNTIPETYSCKTTKTTVEMKRNHKTHTLTILPYPSPTGYEKKTDLPSTRLPRYPPQNLGELPEEQQRTANGSRSVGHSLCRIHPGYPHEVR